MKPQYKAAIPYTDWILAMKEEGLSFAAIAIVLKMFFDVDLTALQVRRVVYKYEGRDYDTQHYKAGLRKDVTA